MKTIVYDLGEGKITDLNCDSYNIDESKFNIHFFDTMEFHDYHQKNSEETYRVLNIKNNKLICIYYFGEKKKSIYMPYSSPFSKFLVRRNLSYEMWGKIIDGFKNIGKMLKVESINITLPPFIYDRNIETQFLMLINNEFSIEYVDINHYFDLKEYEDLEDFMNSLSNKQRKRDYNRVVREGLKFYQIDEDRFEEAFNIIELNRKQRGYPLKMSKSQIEDILKFESSNIDFFIVENSNLDKIASAMVYKVNEEVHQVIYWGHLEEFNSQRPMALLAPSLYEYYKNKNIKYLDIGPSSEDGNININLAQFKVDLGCKNTSKFTLKYNLK